MKDFHSLLSVLALLTALCLLAGCVAGGLLPASDEVSSEPTQPTAAATEKRAETASGEPEGWEEEWPPEYPVEDYRLQEGAISQTGSLNQYRYTQLPGAEDYMNLAADYVRQALDCGDDLTLEEDSPHNGYANWFMTAPVGSASVSGSSITGRFTFGLYPGFDRILAMTGETITDREVLEQAARDFVGRFEAITGELTLVRSGEEPQYYHDERSSELRDVTVPSLVCVFQSETDSRRSLELQTGDFVPVTCGDSSVEDLEVHCFTVTVWPDSTVVWGDNYITRADLTPDGTVRMPTEADLPELLTYMTSNVEHDTLVIESLRADSYSVYFGYAAVEPTLTMTYHLESNPDEHLTTQFSMGLFE